MKEAPEETQRLKVREVFTDKDLTEGYCMLTLSNKPFFIVLFMNCDPSTDPLSVGSTIPVLFFFVCFFMESTYRITNRQRRHTAGPQQKK